MKQEFPNPRSNEKVKKNGGEDDNFNTATMA